MTSLESKLILLLLFFIRIFFFFLNIGVGRFGLHMPIDRKHIRMLIE